MKQLKIQNLIANAGEKVSGLVHIPNTDVTIPITLICGNKEGKTALITGGIHNAEYVGIQSAIEIADSLQPYEIEGNVVIIRLVNTTGFEHRTMSVVYEDDKNLNREFPASLNGTLAEKICHFIEKEFFKIADYYIDLHCGDGYEDLTPFVFCQGKASDTVCELSRNMANAVNVPYLVQSRSDRGGCYNYAGACGIPAILLERGCMGAWSYQEVEDDVKDVKNILRFMKTLIDGEQVVIYNPQPISNVIYKDANCTGCWYPRFKSGEEVQKGQVLGTIKDYFGEVLETYIAEQSGIVLYQTASLCVLKDGPMIAYGEIK